MLLVRWLHNQELSLARANDVKTIIQNSLSKAGRNDVKFDVSGYGETKITHLCKLRGTLLQLCYN
jgi:flagellar motor protein MotB